MSKSLEDSFMKTKQKNAEFGHSHLSKDNHPYYDLSFEPSKLHIKLVLINNLKEAIFLQPC